MMKKAKKLTASGWNGRAGICIWDEKNNHIFTAERCHNMKLIEQQDNAEELLTRWNGYDELKATNDELVELLKNIWEFLLVPATHHGGQTCIISASQMKKQRDKIEQALAKAERSKE